jgi:4-carboxymuconolactone decarboxylase
MPRIPYRDLSTTTEAVRKLVGDSPVNASRLQATAHPDVYQAFHGLGLAFYASSKIAPDLREIAILRVGYIDKSRYETFQHEQFAHKAGLSEAQIQAVRKGGTHAGILSDVQQAVLNFVDDVVKNVRASDAALAEIRKHFTDEMVVDLIMLTGFYMTVTRLLETADIEFEETADAWKSVASYLSAPE